MINNDGNSKITLLPKEFIKQNPVCFLMCGKAQQVQFSGTRWYIVECKVHFVNYACLLESMLLLT